MESKKINQLATNVNPQTSDLTTIGDPITGQLKKITWLQVAHLIGAQAAVTLQQVTDNGNTTTDPITTGGLTLTNLGTGVPQVTNGEFVSTYGYGLANGVATLDSGGKIPASQLPSSVMEYKGTWNASTNTPTLADGTGDNGDVYLVNVAGTQNLGSGNITFAIGDWVVYNGTIWQKSLNSNAVASVFGRTGTIVAQEGDYNIDQLGDVAITSAATNDYLRYNGSSWVNTQFPTFVSSDKLILQVRNTSGATINKGTVVYVNGASGGYPTIAKAIATGDATSAQTLGLVQDNISNNSNGVVVIVGQITGVDTSAYTAGTQLYLSGTTAGAVTSTKPYAPIHLVYVGIVTTQNAVNGVIEVKVQNGVELEELHNVDALNPNNNDGIFYNSTSDLWEHKSIATVLGYTPEQPLTFSSPLVRTTNTISIPAATGSVNGYLTSTDWTTFNNKLTSPMTTLGDIIFGGTSGNANRLAGNITTTKQYLSQTGTGTDSASPTWATITGSDITGAALTKTDDTNVTLTLGGTPTTALLRAASLTLGWTGQLAISRGGTGASTKAGAFDALSPMTTLGDIIYGGASGTGTRLAGNTTTTKQYLSQTGNGTASAAPSWATIAGSDITGAALTETDDTNVTLTLGGTPSTALLRAVSLTLGWTGTLAVSRGGTGAASFTAGQILYGNGTSAISSSSQFTFSPTAAFFINNTISAGGIAMNLTSTVNAAANNDIIYGVRISPTFNNLSFTGVTQRALGVFGDVYINGTITSGAWGGSTITIAKGGTGLTALGTAGQLLRVNSGATALEYWTPNYIVGDGTANILTYYPTSTTIAAATSSANRFFSYEQNSLRLKLNDNSNVLPLILENTLEGYSVGIDFKLGYGGSGTSIGTPISAGRIYVNPEGTWTATASTQDATMTLYTAQNGVMGAGLSILSDKTIKFDGYSTNGFVKTSSANGTITIDTTTYQPLLTNPVTGTGADTRVMLWTGSTTAGGTDAFTYSVPTLTLGLSATSNQTDYKLLIQRHGTLANPGTWTDSNGLQIVDYAADGPAAGFIGTGLVSIELPRISTTDTYAGNAVAFRIANDNLTIMAVKGNGNTHLGQNGSSDTGERLQVNGAAKFSGNVTSTAFIPTGSSIPTNGMYLSTANTLGFATNSGNAATLSTTSFTTFSTLINSVGLYIDNGLGGGVLSINSFEGSSSFIYLKQAGTNIGAITTSGAGYLNFQHNNGTNLAASFYTNGDGNILYPKTESRVFGVAKSDAGNAGGGNLTVKAGGGVGTGVSGHLYLGAGAGGATNGDIYLGLASTSNANTAGLSSTYMTIKANSNIGIGTSDVVSTNLTGAVTIRKTYNNDTPNGATTQNYYGNQSALFLFGRNSGLSIISNNGEAGSINFANNSTAKYSSINSLTGTSSVGGDMYFNVGSDTERLRISATTGSINIVNNLTVNTPSEGNTGEGIIAGRSFKIDASGSGQTAKMYVVSNTLSDTYGSGLQIQFAKLTNDAGFGFNLNTSGGYETYVKNGTGSWLRAMTIKNDASVGIGTTNAFAKLHVQGTPDSNYGNLTLFDDRSAAINQGGVITFAGYKTTTSASAVFAQIKGNKINSTSGNEAGYLGFFINNNTSYQERSRITSDHLLVGMDSSSLDLNGWSFQTSGGGHTSFQVTNNEAFIFNNRTTGTTFEIDFRTNSVERGKISVTDSGTTYGTGSDYRIKEDFKSFNGLDILKNIKVYDFMFKETKERSLGVIAHELQEVLPMAVYGTKDQVKENGTMKIQQVDYSKIVPVLVKAIQEQEIEIQSLKSKLA